VPVPLPESYLDPGDGAGEAASAEGGAANGAANAAVDQDSAEAKAAAKAAAKLNGQTFCKHARRWLVQVGIMGKNDSHTDDEKKVSGTICTRHLTNPLC
jgi:hypothetical protein